MSTRDKSIWEAIEAGTFKQARALIAKAQKKAPKNTYYAALTALVSFLSGNKEEALKKAEDLLATDPSDQRTVMLLSNVFTRLERPDRLLPLFEGYAKKNPAATTLETWLWAMVDSGNTYGQQRAAMALSKVEKSRRSTNWAVYSGLVALEDGSIPDKERAIISMLSTRMCEQQRPFISAEEVYVYVKLLWAQGKKSEAIETLQKDAFFWNNLELTIMLREYLKESEQWSALFDHSKKVVVDQDLDDWAHWKTLIEGGLKSERSEEVKEVIEKNKKTRNSLLAAVELAHQQKQDISTAVQNYFAMMGSKLCAYDDLKDYVENSDIESVLKMIGPTEDTKISTLKEAIIRVNVEKLKYLVSKDKTDTASFVDKQISLYQQTEFLLAKKDPKEYHVGDDFLLIATCSLLEEYAKSHDLSNVTKAIILLEHAVSRDQHQFYVRLWLTRLYLILGLFPSAESHYLSLSVKTIQHDVCAHFLLSRVSTLFPLSSKLVSKALTLYPENDHESPMLIKHAYNHSTFSKIGGFVEFKKRLDFSQTRALLVLEQLRMSEYARQPIGAKPQPTQTLMDQRDDKIMWSVNKTTDKSYGDRITVGPKQGETWTKAYTLNWQIQQKLGIAEFGTLLEELTQVLGEASDLTEAEKWQLNVTLLCAELARDKLNAERFTKLKEQLTNHPVLNLETCDWSYVHTAFTVVEATTSVKRFLTGVRANRLKCDKAGLDSTYKQVGAVLDHVKKNAGEVKNLRTKAREQDIELLGDWALNKVKMAPERFEDVIEGVHSSRDKVMTGVRAGC
ncbi:N-terminal acetyltransferase B complex subunit arm1 [Yarrowia sp. E02]|nr:N-terminal acetyltransferase B complex subunit arm1 [Yarrowia sp. E02]